jgi:pyruvate-formate lyase
VAEAAPFLFESMLIDDCLGRGEGVFGGGVRYRGVLVETYGNITTANSLEAIRCLVYDEKAVSANRMLHILETNFEGYERERRMMLNAPKYGNDNATADAMAATVHTHMASVISSQAERLGLDFCLADMINVDAHIMLGQQVGATPDGRRARAPLTNANSPMVGSDTRGPTALLNSLVKLDLSQMGGQVQYLKFSKDLFNGTRDRLDALLTNYFAQGGNQAMITVVGRGDLEAAMREPEKYPNLYVRVGGFSARFVDLPRATQEDILARTLH